MYFFSKNMTLCCTGDIKYYYNNMTKQRLNGAQMGQQLFSVILFFFNDLFTPQQNAYRAYTHII